MHEKIRPSICYKLSASGKLRMPNCPQKCMIKKDNVATNQQELYKSFEIWKHFDTLGIVRTPFLHYTSSLI